MPDAKGRPTFKELISGAVEKGKADGEAQVRARAAKKAVSQFEGASVDARVITYEGASHPVAGAHARVETHGEIKKRVTVTRVAAMGVFALAARKKISNLFLTIEHDNYQLAIPVPLKKRAEALTFASRINTISRSASGSE